MCALIYTLSLFLVLVFLLYKHVTRNFDYWKVRNIPFIKPVPFLGNFYEVCTLKMVMGECIANLYQQVKAPFFGIFVFDRPCLVVKSPELIKTVLVKDFNNFKDRTMLAYEKADPLAAHLLFAIKNPAWRFIRTKLTPVFTSGKLKGMLPLIKEVAEEMNRLLEKHCDKTVNVKELCSRYSTDVISSCAFGINSHSLTSDWSPFRDAGSKLFDFRYVTAIRQLSYFFGHSMVKLFKLRTFDPDACKFLAEAFEQTIKEREFGKERRNDLIDIIIDMKKEDTIGGNVKFEGITVVAQAVQFFIAGFETTGSTISFTLYELALNFTIQNKLRADVNAALKKHGSFTYEALQDMQYLDQCISETLRKYPVLPFLDRVAAENYQIPETDVIIEKGTFVYIPMFGLHYDPEYFPEPQKYNPERFNEKNRKNIPPYSYIPFGQGPRNCIGERFGLISTKIAVSHIVSKYEICRAPETPEKLKFGGKTITLNPVGGVPLVLKRTSIEAA